VKETVEQVKADLVARGEDMSGPCGAFKITKRVAWALRDSGAGLLSKPSGNNCEGYATDVICYPDGRTFDILIDGGGQNGPTWEQHHPHDPAVAARYRPAIDPGDGPQPEPEPEPEPEPQPQPVDLSAVLAQLQRMSEQLDRASNDARDAKVAAQLALSVARDLFNRPIPDFTVRAWGRTIATAIPEGQ
jgi:hypothetical protein